MRKFLTILILSICMYCYAQKIEKYDTIIDMNYYKAYYAKNIKSSSFVIYKLYKGGGDISRSNISFKTFNNLPHFEYLKSGYDKGHLIPAEDFANDTNKLKSTFYYINCIPQVPKLNRGIWKKYENDIRKISQNDSLLIICGGCNYKLKKSIVPTKCFKIVYNLKTKKCIYSLIFDNDNSGNVIDDKTKRKISFKKSIELYNK